MYITEHYQGMYVHAWTSRATSSQPIKIYKIAINMENLTKKKQV